MTFETFATIWNTLYLPFAVLYLWAWWWPRLSRPWMRTLKAEAYPFYPAAILIDLGVDLWGDHGAGFDFYSLVMHTVALLGWLLWDNDDDERWKRRRRKLAQRVARAGARLVVVPEAGR
jgi:hypothetical protein